MIAVIGNLTTGAFSPDIRQVTGQLPSTQVALPVVSQTPVKVAVPSSALENSLYSKSSFPFQLSAASFAELFDFSAVAGRFSGLFPSAALDTYTQASLLTASRLSLVV